MNIDASVATKIKIRRITKVNLNPQINVHVEVSLTVSIGTIIAAKILSRIIVRILRFIICLNSVSLKSDANRKVKGAMNLAQ